MTMKRHKHKGIRVKDMLDILKDADPKHYVYLYGESVEEKTGEMRVPLRESDMDIMDDCLDINVDFNN